MKRVILGTAGHIDHGKTTLVKALTGIDTDRLPEEKARGITIDLGFAHLQLGDLDIGIVDVPGHEGLIRNMLAGATGFDAVLLVIAADEGVMPQTREHVAIARLLRVHAVVVALTKADTVEPDWLELVRADVEAFVKSEIGAPPVIPVSAVTGDGLDALRACLAKQLAASAERRTHDLFRMPIDRVFSVRGTGTVVTGTVWSGRATRQDILRVLPAGTPARVRGVQTHGRQVDAGSAGERVAFALAGAERENLTRGDVLVSGDAWFSTRAITARVQLLENVQLEQRQRIRVHLGTAETLARVVLLGDAWVQLRMEAPLVARAGDRFIIRSYSPVRTIGGGEVAELDRARKHLTDTDRHLLEQVLDGNAGEKVIAAVTLAGEAGSSLAALPVLAGVTTAEVVELAAATGGDVVQLDGRLYHSRLVEATIERLCADVDAYHARYPLEAGIERASLLGRFRFALAPHALVLAELRGLLRSTGSLVARPGFEPGFSPSQMELRSRLLEQLREARLTPPFVPELTAAHRTNEVRGVLRLMEARGEVAAIHPDLYVDRAALLGALAVVRAGLGTGPLSAAEFKAVLPVSRKYLIPLLEYMDRVGVTKRVGDVRWIIAAEQPETA